MPHSEATPSDILGALIYLADEEFLMSDPRQLHGAIYMDRGLCPLLDKHFVFSKRAVYPSSRALDEAIGILQLSRILRYADTDFEWYRVDREVLVDFIRKFTEEEVAGLRLAAGILRESCGGKANFYRPALVSSH